MPMKKKFSVFEHYFDCWKYIKQCKMQIYSVVSLFFIFTIIGFFVPVPEGILKFILDYIKKILMQTENLSVIGLIFFIFLNNLQASFFGLFSGVFFGIFPVLFAGFNGYILGVVASLTVSQEGFLFLINLLPHGIFELPAVFISLGIGLKLGGFIFQKNKKEFLGKNLIKSTKVFFLVVLPLLIIAAIIEGALISFMG
jgi:stage II sporulation protein M